EAPVMLTLCLLLALGDGDPDVELFSKAVSWALKDDPKLSGKDEALAKRYMERALRRGSDETRAWTRKKGKVIRGFRSAIDDSVQPYGVLVPEAYDPAKP